MELLLVLLDNHLIAKTRHDKLPSVVGCEACIFDGAKLGIIVRDGNSMHQDYYHVLARIVVAIAPKDARMRSRVYDFARHKLQQQLDRQSSVLNDTEKAKQLLELETAIEQIEVDLGDDESRLTYSAPKFSSAVIYPSVEIIPPGLRRPPLAEPHDEFTVARNARPPASLLRSAIIFVVAAALGAVTYTIVQRELHWTSPSDEQTDQGVLNRAIYKSNPSVASATPTPGAYGVYALVDGQLTELQPLPIRIPEAKIAISGTISSPSATKLPNGRMQFIAFRRDLVNNAPEKVVVRVVARVMHTLAISNGRVVVASSDPSWTVRRIFYEMKVAPLDSNLAMILIRPASPDFLFPAGRYALILKTMAYDFSVDGSITELTQCVEVNEEDSAPEYIECRKE